MKSDSLSAEQLNLVQMLRKGVDFDGSTNQWMVKYHVSGSLHERTMQFTLDHEVEFDYIDNSQELLGWVGFWVYGQHVNLRGGQMCRLGLERAWGSGATTGDVFGILPMSIEEFLPFVVVGWNGDLQLIQVVMSEGRND